MVQKEYLVSMKTKLELKDEQLDFTNQIIVNLKHLKKVFKDLNEEEEIIGVDNLLHQFYYRQEKVMDEINEMYGYGSYKPENNQEAL